MTKVRVKFNAPEKDVYVCGDLKLQGGETSKLIDESDAVLLARDPQIEIIGSLSKAAEEATKPAEPEEEAK